MQGLVPTPITDRNGKATTVHRRLATDSSALLSRVSGLLKPAGALMGTVHKTDLGEIVPEPYPYNPADAASYEPAVFHHYDGQNPIPIAPAGYSGARCPECLSFLTRDELRDGQQGASVECPNCHIVNSDQDYGDFNVALSYESRRMFDSDNVRAEVWFHATVKDDWFTEVSESEDRPIIHVGSLDAAIARAKATAAEHPGSEFAVYALRIRPDAEITPTIIVDADNLAPSFVSEFPDYGDLDDDDTDFPDTFSPTAIGRYVNGFEDHGSVSLVSVPSNFEVAATMTFDIDEIDSARSFF